MTKSDTITKIIIIDADVISHFIANNALHYLPSIIAPNNIIVLDFVYDEIARNPIRLSFLDCLIKNGSIRKVDFPENNLEIKQEFAKIKRNNYLIGDGERACMAYARYNNNIIASSIFRDIATYCKENNIYYLGTLDILILAFKRGVFTENQCDDFINKAIEYNKARFPKRITKISQYEPIDLSFLE